MKIAIYGPMCSGKSTVASIIQKHHPKYEVFSFGKKIKNIAEELFDMKGKDRSLLINIADKMRDIDKDVWVNYIINQTNEVEFCIIDDLRFQNELDKLSDWTIISLITPLNTRLQRIIETYPTNYEDHLRNMKHKSETDTLQLPQNTHYIDTTIPYDKLTQIVLSLF
jgi:cytidylate kinase